MKKRERVSERETKREREMQNCIVNFSDWLAKAM
jgi:hypothetical protein